MKWRTLAVGLIVSVLGTSVWAADLDAWDEPIASYKAFADNRAFFAPKVLGWTFRDYDKQALLDGAIAYLTGDGVEQDLERAAILVGAVMAEDGSNSWRPRSALPPALSEELLSAVGHAAHTAALQLEGPEGSEGLERYRNGLLEIASEVGHQPALLMRAYRFQIRRNSDGTTAHRRRVANSYEIIYFEQAAACNDQNLTQKLFPWSRESCDAAEIELRRARAISDELIELARTDPESPLHIRKRQEPSWGLIVLAGLVNTIAAQSKYTAGADAAQLQQERLQRQHRQQESTWAHIGAAMFVQ